jgi:hypothetical protein
MKSESGVWLLCNRESSIINEMKRRNGVIKLKRRNYSVKKREMKSISMWPGNEMSMA